MVTDEKTVRMGDAAIARLEFSLISGKEEELAKIGLNGVPVSDISREKAGEMFPDFTGGILSDCYVLNGEITIPGACQ